LLPVSSQFGTAAGGKLLSLGRIVEFAWANAECALRTSMSTMSRITGMVYLLIKKLVNLIGILSVGVWDSFTSPSLDIYII
jgi:hypothetical protein